MDDCVFCGIVKKTVPATIVFDNDEVMAFKDNNPVAPIHFLIIPKRHYPSFEAVSDPIIMNQLLTVAKELGAKHSADLGYRVLINSAQQAEVDHAHVHLLGGLRPEAVLSPQGGDDT